ncbi:MAG: prepilin-type N-terminal cleavage/methylation domain-containing protein [Betaproteobacteria bacterium]|nr:prepilin-type N-terminal cleavage/methylation domain-containing protein [Betaproteobacteria bacterium]
MAKLRRGDGFTLLEMLVACMLLALAMGVLMQVFSRGVNGATAADQKARAMLLAESKFAALGLEDALKEGETNGKFDDDYAWALSVKPYVDPNPKEPPPAGAPADGNIDALLPVQLMEVTLMVTYNGGDNRERNVTLSSLSLAPRT